MANTTASAVTSAVNAKQIINGAQVDTIESKLMDSWIVKLLLSFLPGGALANIITMVINAVEQVEQQVAISKSGVLKKQIVVSVVSQQIEDTFGLSGFDFVIKWAVGELVDVIVWAKNTFGWSWLPKIVS